MPVKGNALAAYSMILRPIYWQQAPFGKLQALPTNAKPVMGRDWHSRDEAFLDVALGIHKAIETLVVPYPPDSREIRDPPPGTTLVTYREHVAQVRRVAWSPKDERIASGDDGLTPDQVKVPATVQVWDATTGRRFLTHQDQVRPESSIILALAWSPNGTRIASIDGAPIDGILAAIWDATTGHVLFTYQGVYGPLAWSPDGTCLVSTYITDKGKDRRKDTIQIWRADDRRNLLTWTVGPRHEINTIAWSPDGTRIISGGKDIPEISYYGSAAGTSGGEGSLQVWDAKTGNRLLVCQGTSVRVIACSPDGTRIAAGGGDGTVLIREATRGEELLTYREHGEGWISALVWSPDGTYIASGGGDKAVHVWDALSGRRLLTYRGHPQGVSSIAWSPDSRRIASAGHDTTVQVWQAI